MVAADDDDRVDRRVGAEDAERVLVLLRRVADRVGDPQVGDPAPHLGDVRGEAVRVQGRLEDDLDLRVRLPRERPHLLEVVEDAVSRRVEVLRVADDLAVPLLPEDGDEAAVVEGAGDLPVDVRDELAGRVDGREAEGRRLRPDRRRDAVGREDDSPRVLVGLLEPVDRREAERGHLALDALVVDDLPEDRPGLPLRRGDPDELVRHPDPGAEPVLLGEDDLHGYLPPPLGPLGKVQQDDLGRDHLHEAVALDQLEALAAAPDDVVTARDGVRRPLRVLERQRRRASRPCRRASRR